MLLNCRFFVCVRCSSCWVVNWYVLFLCVFWFSRCCCCFWMNLLWYWICVIRSVCCVVCVFWLMLVCV